MISLNKIFIGGTLASKPVISTILLNETQIDLQVIVEKKFLNPANKLETATSIVNVTTWGDLAISSLKFLNSVPFDSISSVIVEGWVQFNKTNVPTAESMENNSRNLVIAEQIQFIKHKTQKKPRPCA